MMITNWEISRKDHDLAVRIADRAVRQLHDYPDNQRTVLMDLIACHANGCPLYFEGLLVAEMLDFSHDICGIRDHINRDTGKLEGHPFTPRYARANHVIDVPAGVIAELKCRSCGKRFHANSDKVPTLDLDGLKQPICRRCIEGVNSECRRLGERPWPIPEGAYID